MSRGHVALIHYHKVGAKMGAPWTVHYRGKCYLFNQVFLEGKARTVFKPERKTNPRAWIRMDSARLVEGMPLPGCALLVEVK